MTGMVRFRCGTSVPRFRHDWRKINYGNFRLQ
ncbi:hypothetical protein [Caudoviricetes sp.]|nr:hypothetical protein [Caudoviricetes sp.]